MFTIKHTYPFKCLMVTTLLSEYASPPYSSFFLFAFLTEFSKNVKLPLRGLRDRRKFV